jgi:hypothetical protein
MTDGVLEQLVSMEVIILAKINTIQDIFFHINGKIVFLYMIYVSK